MRFNLIDLLLAIFTISIGLGSSGILFRSFLSQPVLGLVQGIAAVGIYLLVLPPLYRRLKLLPLLLPRCPLCKERPDSLQFIPRWPRIQARCVKCGGDFVIWANGKPTAEETWETPVLSMKWPYIWGPYKKEEKPEQTTAGSENE